MYSYSHVSTIICQIFSKNIEHLVNLQHLRFNFHEIIVLQWWSDPVWIFVLLFIILFYDTMLLQQVLFTFSLEYWLFSVTCFFWAAFRFSLLVFPSQHFLSFCRWIAICSVKEAGQQPGRLTQHQVCLCVHTSLWVCV